MAQEQGVVLGVMELQVDANAAIGIVGKQGFGKVMHLDLSHLWIQVAVTGKLLALKNMPTGNNNMTDGHWNNIARQRYDHETYGKSAMCPIRPVDFGDG